MNQKIAILMLVTSCWAGSTIIAQASGTSSSSASWGSSSDSSGSGETTPGTSTHSDMGLWDSSSGENTSGKNPSSGHDIWDSGSETGSPSQDVGSLKSHAASLYDRGFAASSNKDYQKALELFEQALKEDSNNPDILNMLAHTQRKLGMTDEALANYKKALELRPRFPEAREYLGEAYIQAALQEMATLKSYGSEADENLEDLTKAFKDAAGKL
jgi:tetratricopeptide (TPR) repeat protein